MEKRKHPTTLSYNIVFLSGLLLSLVTGTFAVTEFKSWYFNHRTCVNHTTSEMKDEEFWPTSGIQACTMACRDCGMPCSAVLYVESGGGKRCSRVFNINKVPTVVDREVCSDQEQAQVWAKNVVYGSYWPCYYQAPGPVTLPNGQRYVCGQEDKGSCDWVVFQRRGDAQVSFDRSWAEYKNGFGDFNGNFWLGLDKIHQLTISEPCELRVTIIYDGKEYYADYSTFKVAGGEFRLTIGGYSGTAGNGLSNYHNGKLFTTKDNDNDQNGQNLAQRLGGGWWYFYGFHSALNSAWRPNARKETAALYWVQLTGYNRAKISYTEMKIRPKRNSF